MALKTGHLSKDSARCHLSLPVPVSCPYYSSKDLRIFLEKEKHPVPLWTPRFVTRRKPHEQRRRVQRQPGASRETRGWMSSEGRSPSQPACWTGEFFATGTFLYEFKLFGQFSEKAVSWPLWPPLSFGSGNPERQVREGWRHAAVLNAFPVPVFSAPILGHRGGRQKGLWHTSCDHSGVLSSLHKINNFLSATRQNRPLLIEAFKSQSSVFL